MQKNIDCGYPLEPPHLGDQNEYSQSMFLSRNKKSNVYPCKPQFYYIKVGLRGSKLYRHVFMMSTKSADSLTGTEGPGQTIQICVLLCVFLPAYRIRAIVLSSVSNILFPRYRFCMNDVKLNSFRANFCYTGICPMFVDM